MKGDNSPICIAANQSASQSWTYQITVLFLFKYAPYVLQVLVTEYHSKPG